MYIYMLLGYHCCVNLKQEKPVRLTTWISHSMWFAVHLTTDFFKVLSELITPPPPPPINVVLVLF